MKTRIITSRIIYDHSMSSVITVTHPALLLLLLPNESITVFAGGENWEPIKNEMLWFMSAYWYITVQRCLEFKLINSSVSFPFFGCHTPGGT